MALSSVVSLLSRQQVKRAEFKGLYYGLIFPDGGIPFAVPILCDERPGSRGGASDLSPCEDAVTGTQRNPRTT